MKKKKKILSGVYVKHKMGLNVALSKKVNHDSYGQSSNLRTSCLFKRPFNTLEVIVIGLKHKKMAKWYSASDQTYKVLMPLIA